MVLANRQSTPNRNMAAECGMFMHHHAGNYNKEMRYVQASILFR